MLQAEIYERTRGVVPSVSRPSHAAVIGTEWVQQQYEVAVTAPTLRICHDALQQVRP